MTFQRQQAVEVVRPPVIRPAMVLRVDRVVAVALTQALHYDYTATFSAQRLSQVMPSYRAVQHSIVLMFVHCCRFWVVATSHNLCATVYEVIAVERSQPVQEGHVNAFEQVFLFKTQVQVCRSYCRRSFPCLLFVLLLRLTCSHTTLLVPESFASTMIQDNPVNGLGLNVQCYALLCFCSCFCFCCCAVLMVGQTMAKLPVL